MKRVIIVLLIAGCLMLCSQQVMSLPAGAVARLGKGRINAVTFSPDGKTLAVASSCGVCLYDPSTLVEIGFFETDDWMTSLSFNKDGSLLASGSGDHTVKLWNVKTHALVAMLSGYSGSAVSFSPDGSLLASVSEDKTIKLWDVKTLASVATLSGHSDWVISVSFSPDGSLLASGSGDKTIKLWDVKTRTLLATLSGHSNLVRSVSFSPDGSLLASSSEDIKLWDVKTCKEVATLPGHSYCVESVTFSPDGSLLASGSYDGAVNLWDVKTRKEVAALSGHSDSVESVTFSPNGSLLASGSKDNTVKLWNVKTRALVATLSVFLFNVNSVSFSPDGSLLASGSDDRTIKLWDVKTRALVATLSGHSQGVLSVSFSPNGSLLASGSEDETIKLWDVKTRALVTTLPGHLSGNSWVSFPVYSVSFNPDGNMLASVGGDSNVKLWDVKNRKEVTTLSESGGRSVSFSSDGSLLASGSWDKPIKLWDVKTRALVDTLSGHLYGVNSVSFSPDGSLLVSGSDDNTVKLWDVKNHKEVATLSGHSDDVNSVTFSPDGSLLASGSDDRTIKLWDVKTRALVTTLSGHIGYVLSVSFNPDGSMLASGGDYDPVLLWDMTPYMKVQPVNRPPTADSQSVTTNEDTPVTIKLTGSDPDGDKLTFKITSQPKNGILSGTPPDVTYMPKLNFNGTDSFAFTANDGTADSQVATVTITINPVNDLPTANPQSVTTNEDTPVEITLSGSDPEGSNLIFKIVSQSANGSLVNTPLTKEQSNIVFDSGNTEALGAETTIRGHLVPQLVGETINLKLFSPDGKTTTTSVTTSASGIFTYSLKLDTAGNWTITASWGGNDRYNGSTKSLVISARLEVGKVILILGGGDKTNNPDWSIFNSLMEYVYKVFIRRGFGEDDIYLLSPDPTQSTSADNITSIISLEYAITKWAAAQANKNVPLYIYILSPLNLSDGRLLIEKHGNQEVYLTPTQLDSWLDRLAIGTQVTIIIEASYSGNFIQSSDGKPTALVNRDRIIITSAGLGKQSRISTSNLYSFSKFFLDQISANKTIGESFSYTEDFMERIPFLSGQSPLIEADGDGIPNSPGDYSAVSGRYISFDMIPLRYFSEDRLWDVNDKTALILNTPLTSPKLTYTPNPNFNGVDSFTFVANDGTADSKTATITITVKPVNDPPSATSQVYSSSQDTSVTITLAGSDPDGDKLTFRVTVQSKNGSLIGTEPNLTYKPNAGFSGSDNFTFIANDGKIDSQPAIVTITIKPVILPPTAIPQTIATGKNTPTVIKLSGSDPDGDRLTFRITSQPKNGALNVVFPDVTYTPNSGFSGTDSFTFTVNDGSAESSPASVTIKVSLISDPELVVYYSFDGFNNVVYDESGKRHNGAVIGDVKPDAGGKRAGAAKFIKGSYLDLNGASFPTADIPTDAVTVCAWVKPDNTGDHISIFNARSADGTSPINPELLSNGTAKWELRSAGDKTIIDIVAGRWSPGQWTHFAGVYGRAGPIALYINGEMVGEAPGNAKIAGDWAQGAYVGSYVDLSRQFAGFMDDFCIFKRELSQPEIKKLMVSGPSSVTLSWTAQTSTASLPADGKSTAIITAAVMDSNGKPLKSQSVQIIVWNNGLGKLSGVKDNGDGTYTATYTSPTQPGTESITVTVAGRTKVVDITINPITQKADFTISAITSEIAISAGESAVYMLKLEGKDGFSDSIELSTRAYQEISSKIKVGFDPDEVILSKTAQSESSQLTLTIPGDFAPGDYSFTVNAIADGGLAKKLTLTLKVKPVSLMETLMSIVLDPREREVPLNGRLKISGQLINTTSESIKPGDARVQIILTSPGKKQQTFEARTDNEGNYQLDKPFSPDEVGKWNVRAQFDGNVQFKSSYRDSTFTVTIGQAKIAFNNRTTEKLGTEITISGQLEPQNEGELIEIKILRPDKSSETLSVRTKKMGLFRYPDSDTAKLKLDKAGDWEFTALWKGNSQYSAVEKAFVINVPEEKGMAIIVLGPSNKDDQPDWTASKNLAEYVYGIFIKRGIGEGDIYFLSPDLKNTKGADHETSVTELEKAITVWAKLSVNAQIPLFIYILAHNDGEKILIERRGENKKYLTPAQLGAWLDQLEGVPVTIIIESCYSGNFIRTRDGKKTDIVSPDRNIIVSARNDELSYIGINNMYSFTKKFFDLIDSNKTISEAFSETEKWMERLKYSHPQMDTDGDGRVNDAPDYAKVKQTYIPTFVSKAMPPEITSLTKSQTLPEGTSSLDIRIKIDGFNITGASATVIPPGFDPAKIPELRFPEVKLAEVSGMSGEYSGAYTSFSLPGEYLVIIDAENDEGYADPVLLTINVPSTIIKGDVNNDGKVSAKDALLVSQYVAELKPLTDDQKQAADMNNDGKVDSRDTILILRKSAESAAPGRDIGSALFQNYPNPFNPETWIPYQLMSGEDVTIRIYKVSGEMVRELKLGYKTAGVYSDRNRSAYWDGRDSFGIPVASGVYFYGIHAGDFYAVRKLIISR